MTFKRMIKLMILYCAKYTGCFALTKRLTRRKYSILGYHQCTADTDYLEQNPAMAVSPGTLAKRLEYIATHGFHVVPLDDCVRAAVSGNLPNNSVVLTVDDGWYSTAEEVDPLMKAKGFPYTVYVTSYYAIKQLPLFNHVIRYMFWKTDSSTVNLEQLGLASPLGKSASEDVSAALANEIVTYGQTLSSVDRHELSARIGAMLGVSYDKIIQDRLYSSMNAQEIKALAASGVDIELHSYSHRWPHEREAAIEELRKDRAFLEPLVGKQLRHFCYPSGNWSLDRIPPLREMGVVSATTCDPGMNDSRSNPFTLKRFLDHEHVRQIEFEAELCGFNEFLRMLRSRGAAR